jgi:hypothetical protein
MLLKRFRTLFICGLSLLGMSSLAMAQGPAEPPINDYLPFRPSEVADRHNYQPFERYNSSNYGRGAKANEGYFFQYDRLIWAMTGPKKTDIGDAASAGIIDNGGGFAFLNLNSLDTGFIKTDWDWGNRYELGYMTKDDGWLVSLFHLHEGSHSILANNVNIAFNDPLGINSQFVDFNGDGIDDDIDGNMIFGNTSPNNVDTSMPPDGTLDAYVGPDFGDLLSLPVTFGSFAAVNRTSVWNIEVMRMMRWNPLHYGGNFEWMYGLRYLQISDNFDLSATAGQGVFTSLAINSDVRNQIFGPQIGMRWNRQNERWTVNFEARFLAGLNFQQAELQGLTTGAGGALQIGTVNAFRDTVSDTIFAPTGEFRLETAYQLTKAVSLRMGYTGMIVGGTTRASRRIVYNLPDPFLNGDNLRETFFVNGFNFGIEVNR